MTRFAVLGSRTALKQYATVEGFGGGVYLHSPAPDLPWSVASAAESLDAIYIEELPHFMAHAARMLPAAATVAIVTFRVGADGRPIEVGRCAARDFLGGAAPGSLESRVAIEVERAVGRALASGEVQRRIASVVMQAQRDILNDIAYLLSLRAGLASADFVLANMPLHALKASQQDLRRDAVLKAPADGLFLEFGVWKGRWLRFLAGERPVQFYGFDSFEGLPEPWSIRPTGTFDLKGEMPEMPPNVTLVKGWFENTLQPFLEAHPGEPVSYIDMDCDIYSATSYVLETLKSRLRVGTVILLDDFLIKPGWERAEHKAFMDFVARYGVKFDYTGYCSMSASVVLTDLGRITG